jgi:hypothetical protein
MAYVDYEISGQWVEIYAWDVGANTAASTSDKPAWITPTKFNSVSTAAKLAIYVQTDDETQFSTDLVTAQTFNFRVRTKDRWSTHALGELIDSVAITMNYDCSASILSGSPAISNAAVTYTVQADGSTPTTSDTTTVTHSVGGCLAKN